MKKIILLASTVLLFNVLSFSQGQNSSEKKSKKGQRKSQGSSISPPCPDPQTTPCSCKDTIVLCFDEYGRLKNLPDLKKYSCVTALVYIDKPTQQINEFKKDLRRQYMRTLESLRAFSTEQTNAFDSTFGNRSKAQFELELSQHISYLNGASVSNPTSNFLIPISSITSQYANLDSPRFYVNGNIVRDSASSKFFSRHCFRPGIDSITIRFINPMKKFVFELYRDVQATSITQSDLDSFRAHLATFQRASYTLDSLKKIPNLCERADIEQVLASVNSAYSLLLSDPLFEKTKDTSLYKRWLWLTNGKTLLNPFAFTSPDRFVPQLNKADSIKLKYQKMLTQQAFDSLYSCCRNDFKYADEVLARQLALENGDFERQILEEKRKANEKQWIDFQQTSSVYNVVKLATQKLTYNYLPDFAFIQYDALSKKRLPADKESIKIAEPGKVVIGVHNVEQLQQVTTADFKTEKFDDQNDIQRGLSNGIGEISKLISLVNPLAASGIGILNVLNTSPARQFLDIPAGNILVKKSEDKKVKLESTDGSLAFTIVTHKTDGQVAYVDSVFSNGDSLTTNLESVTRHWIRANHPNANVSSIDSFISQNFRLFSQSTYRDQRAIESAITSAKNAYNSFARQRNRRNCIANLILFTDAFTNRLPNLIRLAQDSLPPNSSEIEEQINKTPRYRTVIIENPAEEAPYKASQSIVLNTKVSADSVSKRSLGKLAYQVGARYRFRPIAGIAYTASPLANKSVTASGNTLSFSNDDDRFRFYAGFKFYPWKEFQLSNNFSLRRDRLSLIVALGIPKPLENYYLGLGVDPIPGFFLGAGVHLYANNRFTIANNTVVEKRPNLALAAPTFFIGIDPATLVKSIGLLGSK